MTDQRGHSSALENSWLDKCPVCRSGQLSPIEEKALFGLMTLRWLECDCGATFTSSDEGHKLLDAGDKSTPVWQQYGKKTLTDREWKAIANGGASSFDWRDSPAHLLLLSYFRWPRPIGDVSHSDRWKTVLNEMPEKALKGFLDEGLLEHAGLDALLEYKYKASELKAMLKQRGLSVSGRKAKLAERLVQSDPEDMREATRGLSLLQCTTEGRTIAERYVAQEKEKRAKVEEQTLQALRQRRFKEASQAVAAFEAQQVFPRGIGIDWKHHNSAHDAAVLTMIFQAKPEIVGAVNDEQMGHLRLAAAMMHLWGTNRAKGWLPDGFEAGPAMDNDAAARMILSQGLVQRSMSTAREIQGMGLEVEKFWSTVEDDKVSDGCRANTAVGWIPLDDPFPSGHMQPLRYPGCRCDVYHRRKK